MTQTNSTGKKEPALLTTFYIGADLYGIEVMKVQEVTGNPTVMPVPLAPLFVRGLINLRGQLATALGLKELFGSPPSPPAEQMSVVCRMDGNLVSLLVDAIGDVLEVHSADFEIPPDNMPQRVKQFVNGIYKLNGSLLSVLDLDKIAQELSPAADVNESRASA